MVTVNVLCVTWEIKWTRLKHDKKHETELFNVNTQLVIHCHTVQIHFNPDLSHSDASSPRYTSHITTIYTSAWKRNHHISTYFSQCTHSYTHFIVKDWQSESLQLRNHFILSTRVWTDIHTTHTSKTHSSACLSQNHETDEWKPSERFNGERGEEAHRTHKGVFYLKSIFTFVYCQQDFRNTFTSNQRFQFYVIMWHHT